MAHLRQPHPAHHHRTTTVTPSTAQALLAAYLKSSEDHPYLHPTSLLTSTGIKHGPNSGPSGGLAMHHLRRIEAGLQGHSLTAETNDELRARFGEEEMQGMESSRAPGTHRSAEESHLPQSDDTWLDASIAAGGETQKKKRSKDSNGTKKGKRKRDNEEISAWAEESSRAGSAADSAQDAVEFARSREPVMGEVGERDPTSVARQNGVPPAVVKHGPDGAVQVPPGKKAKTEEEKAERKAAKKARNKAKKETKEAMAAG